MPRPLIVAAGFVLAGLFGLGAYFLPVFQAAGTTVGTGALANLDPKPSSAAPFGSRNKPFIRGTREPSNGMS